MFSSIGKKIYRFPFRATIVGLAGGSESRSSKEEGGCQFHCSWIEVHNEAKIWQVVLSLVGTFEPFRDDGRSVWRIVFEFD